MKSALLLALLFAIPAFLRGDGGAGEWTEANAGDGIVVSTRSVAGWGMKEFRAVMRVPSPIGSVVALLEDVDAYPQWFSDCKEARVLKSQGPKERFVFFVNSAPFPVQDREIISHDTFDQNPGTGAVILTLHGEPGLVPPNPGRVRVPRLEGSWTFTPLPGGGVEVVYQVKSDPGGSLPAFIANATVSKAPLKTLTGMRRMLAMEKYRGARPDWLR